MMKKSTKSTRTLWLVLFLACLVSYFFVFDKKIIKLNAEPAKQQIKQESFVFSQETSYVDTTKIVLNEKIIDKKYLKITQADASTMDGWRVMRGHIPININYASYDKATLEILAKQADMAAVNELAFRAEGAGNHEEAVRIYEDAIVKGSSAAITELGRNLIVNGNLQNLPEDDKNAAIHEILALYKVAALRGDLFEASSRVDVFISDNSINLTPELIDSVNARAQQMYSRFEAEREQQGLGPFDNTLPDAVQEYYDKIKIKMPY